ncbi:hypothetical protein KJ708_01085 [bacterium]|nr:hypothetical protein [bacterium]MBU1917851.1 hypothetical protein [bacterium]
MEYPIKLLISIIILAVVSFVGARLNFLNKRLPLGVRTILLTGTEYIFLGVLLGRMGIELIDTATLSQLEPFLLFGLCWVGFMFGLQFEVKRLRKLPLYYFSITAVESVVTFLVVTIPLFFVLKSFKDYPDNMLIMMAAMLGSTATAQSSLAIINRLFQFKTQKVMNLMRYVAGVDGVFALAFFTLALIFVPWGDVLQVDIMGSLYWLFVLFLVGAVPALILILLNKSQFTQQEFFVFLIGITMFCAGLAHVTMHSPLVAGFICGILIANFCKHRLRALSTVLHAEKTIYIALLVLVGASWHIETPSVLIVALIYMLLKAGGKLFGGALATTIFKPVYRVPKTIGLGLLSEGGLAIAIIINFKLLYFSLADDLITIVVLAVLVSELFSPQLILAQFKKEGVVSLEGKKKLP